MAHAHRRRYFHQALLEFIYIALLQPCDNNSCHPALLGGVLVDLQNCHEGVLRDLDLAECLHALLSSSLLLEKLLLAAYIATIALGEDILSQGRELLGRNHLDSQASLDRDLELLPRDVLLELFDQALADLVSVIAVDNSGQGIHRVPINLHLQIGSMACLSAL